MSETCFTPGQSIWWYDSPRQGYSSFAPVKAVFVSYNTSGKTAQIDAILKSGQKLRKEVIKIGKLKPRQED